MDNRKYRYSYQSCVDVCIQNVTRNTCQCYPVAYPSYIQHNNWTQTPFCLSLQLDGNTFLNKSICMTEVIMANLHKCYTTCQPACKEFRHYYNTFDSMWPTKTQQLDFYRQFIQGKPYEDHFGIYSKISQLASNGNLTEAKTLLQQTSLIEDNFAKVSVFFTTTNIVVIEDKPSTSLTDLFARLGGTLNLYSGISLIIVVELVDFLYRILFLN